MQAELSTAAIAVLELLGRRGPLHFAQIASSLDYIDQDQLRRALAQLRAAELVEPAPLMLNPARELVHLVLRKPLGPPEWGFTLTTEGLGAYGELSS